MGSSMGLVTSKKRVGESVEELSDSGSEMEDDRRSLVRWKLAAEREERERKMRRRRKTGEAMNGG